MFSATPAGGIVREKHQPHYQGREYNPLQGDLERWFEPIEDAIAGGACLSTILRYSVGFFGALSPEVPRWRIEVHQFRIEARPDAAGEPTPEGVHRDGVDYVLVLMVDRKNIASGTTTIHAGDGALLGSFTLVDAFDSALVDDARVFHGHSSQNARYFPIVKEHAPGFSARRVSDLCVRNHIQSWWVWEDSNHRPHPYQGCALTT